jgi:hypothetical protein
MSCVFSYPLGDRQTFLLPTAAYFSRTDFPDPRTIGQNQIELVITKLNFEAKNESSFLGKYGCRRFSKPDQVSRVEDHLLGGDLRLGPLFKAKQVWEWNLILDAVQAGKLEDMVLIQKYENRPLIIHDQRIVMKEAGGRTRALVAPVTGIPYVSAGISYYWMRSFLELTTEEDFIKPLGQNAYRVTFMGKELYTPKMQPIRDDL